jgi:hypothetical protein
MTISSINIPISIRIILAHNGVIIYPAGIENHIAIACDIAAVDEIQSVNNHDCQVGAYSKGTREGNLPTDALCLVRVSRAIYDCIVAPTIIVAIFASGDAAANSLSMQTPRRAM